MARDFTLDDFRTQLVHLRRVGTTEMIGRTPGMAGLVPKGEDPAAALGRVLRMINEMTDDERRDPGLIDAVAEQRIAEAAGSEAPAVRLMLVQFAQVQDVMRQIAKMGLWRRIKASLGVGEFRRSKE